MHCLNALTYGPGHAKMCLMRYVNNKGAEQPAHPCSLISTFVVRCLDSMICILAVSKVSRFQLTSVAEQVGLNMTWSKIPQDMFSRDVAHMVHVKPQRLNFRIITVIFPVSESLRFVQ